MARSTAVFAMAAAAVLSGANADHHTRQYKVRVRNLTSSQPFSPPVIVAHTRDIAVFQEGKYASDAVKLMAEDGDNSKLYELYDDPRVNPYICGYAVADGPLFPGETFRGYMDVDTDKCEGDIVYSSVAMLINTNDAFMGIDSQPLVSYGTSKAFPPAFDAGTEFNNELCSHMPGPACPADSGNLEDGPGEGYIHVQRGVHGIGDIEESVYDWRNPVSEVVIFAPKK